MNGDHHEDLTRTALELVGADRELAIPIIHASSTPDHLADVLCKVPGKAPVSSLLDHGLTSFEHFQAPGGRGFCWRDDPSLPMAAEVIGDVGTMIANMDVIGSSGPMLMACADQKGVELGRFRFPSAATFAEYYAWEAARNRAWVGFVLHLVQDACVPHHAWGALLYGHAAWENMARDLWLQHREMLKLSGERSALLISQFLPLVRSMFPLPGGIGELVAANADWARVTFGNPRALSECSLSEVLTVGARAVASTVQALRVMEVCQGRLPSPKMSA